MPRAGSPQSPCLLNTAVTGIALFDPSYLVQESLQVWGCRNWWEEIWRPSNRKSFVRSFVSNSRLLGKNKIPIAVMVEMELSKEMSILLWCMTYSIDLILVVLNYVVLNYYSFKKEWRISTPTMKKLTWRRHHYSLLSSSSSSWWGTALVWLQLLRWEPQNWE